MKITTLIEGYKGISGVYKITNTITDEFYVGASGNIGRRWDQHIRPSHHSPLQKYFQKYGLENFQFQILEITSRENLVEREKYWIEGLKPAYNRAQGGGGKPGREVKKEVRKKMSLAHKIPHPWNKGRIIQKYLYRFPDGSLQERTPNVAGRLINKGINLVRVNEEN